MSPEQAGRPITRREILAARTWCMRASGRQLAFAATDILGHAAHVLNTHYGFDQAVVENPDITQLTELLVALSPPIGQFALFGLLLGDVNASPLAHEHRPALETALRAAEEKPVPWTSWLGQSGPPATGSVDSLHINKDVLVLPAIDNDVLNDLERRVAGLRTAAQELAISLRTTAEEVDNGVSASWPEAGMSDFRETRTAFAETLAKYAELPTDAGFAQFDALLAELRAELIRRHEADRREHEIIELRSQIDSIQTMLKSASEVTQPHLQAALDAAWAKLRGLTGTDEPSDTEPAPAPTDEHANGDGPDRSSSPDHGSGDVDNTEQVAVPAATVEPTVVEPDQADQEGGESAVVEEIVPVPTETSGQGLSDGGTDTLAFPWEDGTPQIAVGLVSAGRLAEAYWVTTTSGESDHRAAVLRFATAAYGVHNSADATAVLAALDLDSQLIERDPDSAAVATSAMLRAGLVAGWAPSMLAHLRPALQLPGQWATLVETATAAVRRGLRVDSSITTSAPDDDTDSARAELGRRAAQLAEELPRRKNAYQRATQVMQRLLRDNQPLGEALNAVIEWAKGQGTGEAVTAAWSRFNGTDSLNSLIEEADAAMRTPRQAREPIVASALRSLYRSVDEVRMLVHEASRVNNRITAERSGADVSARALTQIAVDLKGAEVPQGMAGAAMSLLLRWLLDPETVTSPEPADTGSAPTTGVPPVPAEPTTDVLLVLPDLPRAEDGTPVHDDPRTLVSLARLAQPLNVAAAVTAYCERGDLPSARRTFTLAEIGYWGPDSSDPSRVARMRQAIESARENWLRRHRQDIVAADDLFARVRTQNLLDQDTETSVSGRLQALRSVPDEAFDVATKKLTALTGELTECEQSRIDELRDELKTIHAEPADDARIVSLLNDRDTVTAAEFVAFIRAGKPLPEDRGPVEDDLEQLITLLNRGIPGNQQASPRAWAAAVTAEEDLVHTATTGLGAWESLGNSAGRGGDRMPGAVRNILRTLGLNCSGSPREVSARGISAVRQFRVPATPSDKSYVAMFGSAATTYLITVVLEDRRGLQVADLINSGSPGEANLLLYLRQLDLPARLRLAEQSAGTPRQALVIDPAVMGWISATAPGSWRATQRICLPWTGLNPYTSSVAGLVPPEVFVGRDHEMSEVKDPTGGLFVYGGRQLGKSALLRRVQATFDDGDSHRAVYLDLKGRGIGEAEPAARIWRELAVELRARGVLSAKVAEGATVEAVVNAVRNWLTMNSARRILFLADEADAFLTADSKGVPTPGGVAHFPNVLRLKELMESTERRFKVVFAGLHQVQRFGHLSNVPLAHGGPDILIGPLAPRDAQQLVTEPTAALGYRFQRRELVWRLLSATNYQASLIQIFCEELVNTLLRRRARTQKSPVLITEADVNEVAASDRVRSRIAEKLRITINLEDRYRVLTLVIALHSLDDSFGVSYGPEELLQLARERWSDGFAGLTVAQVRIYLDEMVGLGLLIRLSGQHRYAVRSPNVVNMLGTRSDLESQLNDTVFDLPYQYNPRDARRLLSRAEGVERRSPLTDGQLSQITAPGSMAVVTGTKALGIDRVIVAIRDYAEMRGTKVLAPNSAADPEAVIAAVVQDDQPAIVVFDWYGRTTNKTLSTIDHLVKHRPAPDTNTAVVILVDPDTSAAAADRTGTESVRLARWTAESLRSWPECPFDVPMARHQLIDVTGGWPELVETAIGAMGRGLTQAQALERVQAGTEDAAPASSFLELTDLATPMVDTIWPWVKGFGDEPAPPADLADVVLDMAMVDVEKLVDALDVRGVLDYSDEGIMLDRVVYRCIQTIRADS